MEKGRITTQITQDDLSILQNMFDENTGIICSNNDTLDWLFDNYRKKYPSFELCSKSNVKAYGLNNTVWYPIQGTFSNYGYAKSEGYLVYTLTYSSNYYIDKFKILMKKIPLNDKLWQKEKLQKVNQKWNLQQKGLGIGCQMLERISLIIMDHV